MAKKPNPRRPSSSSQKLEMGQWALLAGQFLLFLWQIMHR